MVLFGGEAKGNVTLGDIYILDVATWKWTRGFDVAPTNARAGHSCSVSNDMFVAYGGYIRSPSIINNPNLLVLYNLTSNSWAIKFTHTPPPITSPLITSPLITSPPITPLPTGSGPGPGPGPGDSNFGSGSSSSSSSNLGAIIGGVAAGAVVVCGLAVWGYRSRKAKDTKLEDGASQQGSPYLSDPKSPTYTKATLVTTSAQQQRFKESQLEEELAISHQIEEQIARLHAMQGRRN
ncbi:MAG: hypothetical protein BYD32DRAFT_217453 [Podila humilis]|nr:MAG: hypothetical protein BYD32DRAFT_217453 [Podila humilis]